MAGQKDRKPICCGEAACCNLLEMFRGILLKLPNKACIMEKNGEDAGKCNFFIDCVKYPGKGRLKGAMGFAAGVGAFLLFFLSDYNDWRWSRRSLRVCFPLGVLLLTAGTAWEIWQGTPPLHGWLRGAAVLLAVFFFGLLVYTLFFALPVEASYARPGEERGACTTGVYALCRHPGVLWFAGLYGCLWAAGGLPLWKAAVLSGLNVGLVAFEDRCVFPAKLKGYDDYRRTTPFLLPSRQSVRAWGCFGKER